jgi:hypothetical protein
MHSHKILFQLLVSIRRSDACQRSGLTSGRRSLPRELSVSGNEAFFNFSYVPSWSGGDNGYVFVADSNHQKSAVR